MPTPKFANLQAILAEESDAETGVVSENAEERLEVEMRKVLIDFFERYFLWCAPFHPVEGSRGMRAETVLTRFGKVRVFRRYVIRNKERPGFVGRVGRCTKACELEVADEGSDRSSFKRAEAVARARGIDISASKIREVTLRRGKEEYENPLPGKIDLVPKGAVGGKRRRTALAAGYGTVPRFRVIGDGATWIGNGAESNFPKQIFTVDCCHALGYVSKVCEFLASDAKEAKDVA